MTQGSPADCSCFLCRNFAAAFEHAYPPPVRQLFETFGIDYQKAAEVYQTHRSDSGLHHYGGWFHFVGEIKSGADAWQQVGKDPNSFSGHLEPFNDRFSIGFTSRLDLVREPFQGKPLVQLEFATQVPWVISDAEES